MINALLRSLSTPVGAFCLTLGVSMMMFQPLALAQQGRAATPASLAPLPPPAKEPAPKQVALGKMLFFDGRLSGDAKTSCATCHDPTKGWTDGIPLSIGYPGSLYFRNTPTVINAVDGQYFYWDGRLTASDVPTMIRDHISEAHFMYADGRLVIERLRQVPAYEQGFKEAFGGEPTYGRILNSVAAFLQTLRSRDVPFDRYLGGDDNAISAEAKRGLELFQGKANCIQCHSGPMLADGGFHKLGLPGNRDIFKTPQRHITFRRFFRTFGIPEYAALREDVGVYAMTKRAKDYGRFRTPTLREVSKTGPYMHDGSLATLQEVIEFYDRGGGSGSGKDPLLKPLELTDTDKADLVEFLGTLSGTPITVEEIKIPDYEIRTLGRN